MISLALLIPGFWRPSLWTDEAATASAVRREWPELFFMLGKVDLVHGFYYVLVKSWTDVAGVNEITLRLPSVVGGAGAIALVVILVRRWAGPRAGLTAGLILALLPRFEFAATDARSYAMTITAVLAALYYVDLLRETLRRSYAFVFGIASTVAVALSFYCVLLVVAVLAVVPLDQRLRRRWRTLVLAAAPSMIVAAWIAVLASGQKFQIAWIPPIDGNVALEVLFAQWFGDATMWTGQGLIPQPSWAEMPAMFVMAFVILPLAAVAIVTRSNTYPVRLAIACILAPIVLLLIASALLGGSYYLPRYVTFTAPAIVVLAVFGIQELGRRGRGARRLVAAIAVLGLVIPGLASLAGQRSQYGRAPDDDFRFVADIMQQYSRPGEAFAVEAGEDLFIAAYPVPFRGRLDITRGISAEEWGLIFNQRFPLESRLDAVMKQSVIWSIHPVSKPEEENILRSRGWVEAARWTGTGHEIVRFVRS
ncbi:glycosyltransferase family 39 protein [Sinomonas sp. P10A9]|uniref:Glycosyltransferase family 39 protein n=1 Tax=Sinomonas puerhi TaxID=3238584 RepID=A0AB39KZP9_9MICC